MINFEKKMISVFEMILLIGMSFAVVANEKNKYQKGGNNLPKRW